MNFQMIYDGLRDKGTTDAGNARTGIERASGVAAPMDLVGNAELGGLDTMIDVGVPGIATAAVYGCLLTALRELPSLRNGSIGKRQYIARLLNAAMETGSNAIVPAAVVIAVLAFIPGLYPLVALAGLFGGGVALYKLSTEFVEALPPAQREELRNAANAASVTIKGLNDTAEDAEPKSDVAKDVTAKTTVVTAPKAPNPKAVKLKAKTPSVKAAKAKAKAQRRSSNSGSASPTGARPSGAFGHIAC